MKSLRGNLVVFALLATLVPAVVLAMMSFVTYRDITQRSVDQELRLVAHGAAGEVALFVRERAQDLRTLSAAALLVEAASSGESGARDRAGVYLRSVHGKLDGFLALTLLDAGSAPLARSTEAHDDGGAAERAPASTGALAVGAPRYDAARAAAMIPLAVPVFDAAGRRVGSLVGLVDLAPAVARLATAIGAVLPGGELLLVASDGTPVAGTPPPRARLAFPTDDWLALRADAGVPARYITADGREMLGVAAHAPALPAYVVAQRERAAVLRAWTEVARWFAVLVVAVALFMGALAWWMGRAIVTPLAALTAAADRVAAGDFGATVADTGRDEVGRLARAFSAMTARLRALHADALAAQADLTRKNAALQRLATTDSLTGLANRKAFDAVLAQRFADFARTRTPFALLMVSVDELDRVNADFGYPAGDELLVDLAAMLRQELRGEATIARFAGERFVALLPGLSFDEALSLAERIRVRADAPGFAAPRAVTVSVGVAQTRDGDSAAETIVFRADHALHDARRSGGNGVRSAM